MQNFSNQTINQLFLQDYQPLPIEQDDNDLPIDPDGGDQLYPDNENIPNQQEVARRAKVTPMPSPPPLLTF